MLAGPEKNCRASPSGIVQPVALAMVASGRIPGVRNRPAPSVAISICAGGIPFRSVRFRKETAISVLPILPETDGNGRALFSGPLPGFEPFSFYPGYSANFFDGKHFVMKGGSPRTAACMLRRSFRNWFQPLYPYVYATFRCVER